MILYYGSKQVTFKELRAETPSDSADITIEQSKNAAGLSKEENRDAISSQHLQVKRSWENPGVYAWGSNSGRVVAPDLDDAVVKLPRRIPFFDGVVLRDLKLDQNFGAAITEKGDLLQWGTTYSDETRQPVETLRGKGLISLAISQDRIIGLAANGTVYSVPVSRADQINGHKPLERSWIPFVTAPSPISYRVLQPQPTSWNEKVTAISSGLEHALLLTSTGRVFSAASSSSAYPARGQMGVPGLGWSTRPSGAYDQPHEITTLRGFDITAIATGDYHSLALDQEGRAFSFGDNTSGQLGFDPSSESPYIDAPSLLPFQKLYAGSGLSPRITSVSAGGANSFFTVDATPILRPGTAAAVSSSPSPSPPGRITADTWACGQGILGTLGTGRWTHIQGTPTKIKPLSALVEYDEAARAAVPIRLARLAVGATHASATMANVTYLGAGRSSLPDTDSPNDTNWGADVLWWGGNEHFQLGTGRRNNVNAPTYIAPLDAAAERDRARANKKQKDHHHHRLQITPRHDVSVHGRRLSLEQRVECGRFVSAVYSGL